LFDNFDTVLADTVSKTINRIYGFEVSILPRTSIPESTFTNQKSPRYRADQLIKILKDTKPDSLDYIIGLIDPDISTTKKDVNGNTLEPVSKYQDWGVFGLGYRPGVSCIVSTYRFRETNRDNFIDRLKKICTHEIGHNLGLSHCPDKDCVMRDAAESIKTIDEVSINLCRNCEKRIK
jgi:archaemetzincin